MSEQWPEMMASAAVLIATAAGAMIELAAMDAANRDRESNGLAQAYGEEQIREVSTMYGLGVNDIRCAMPRR